MASKLRKQDINITSVPKSYLANGYLDNPMFFFFGNEVYFCFPTYNINISQFDIDVYYGE